MQITYCTGLNFQVSWEPRVQIKYSYGMIYYENNSKESGDNYLIFMRNVGLAFPPCCAWRESKDAICKQRTIGCYLASADESKSRLWSLSMFINPQIPNDLAAKGSDSLRNLSGAQ